MYHDFGVVTGWTPKDATNGVDSSAGRPFERRRHPTTVICAHIDNYVRRVAIGKTAG